jgi:Putative beta-barrel porin 2
MGRFFTFWAAFLSAVVVIVLAFAQSSDNPAESPVTVDESRPASVATPTSDARMNEAGQPLTPPAPGRSPQPGGSPQPGRTPMGEVVSPSEEAEAAEEALIPAEPARKLWRFTPLFSTGVVYDDNIEFSNTDRIPDVIWRVSAGLAFELGDFRAGAENYLSAYWLGSPTFYADNPDQNNFNQNAALIAQYRWSKLVGRFDSNVSIARGGNREVNAITTTKSFSNSLRFQYDYSEKTSFDLKFSQDASIVESFQNTSRYEIASGMGYQIFPKTNIGLEFVGGVLASPDTPLQYFQQARLRLNYAATGKLTLKFSGGVEVLEFEGDKSIKASPVFSMGLAYQPFDGTTLNLVGYRNIISSNATAGQDITATGFGIGVEQRFFQKFLAGVSFGYEHDQYFATTSEFPTDRVDNYLYVRPTVRYSFVRWFSVNVFYDFRKNTSTQDTSNAYGNRVGMELAARF